MVVFEPVYYKKEAAERMLKHSVSGSTHIEKVKGDFEFRYKGKNLKRKTGWKLFGGKL